MLGSAFATDCHATASAGVLPFTWDPSQAGLAGSAFTADTIVRDEYPRGVTQPDSSFVATLPSQPLPDQALGHDQMQGPWQRANAADGDGRTLRPHAIDGCHPSKTMNRLPAALGPVIN